MFGAGVDELVRHVPLFASAGGDSLWTQLGAFVHLDKLRNEEQRGCAREFVQHLANAMEPMMSSKSMWTAFCRWRATSAAILFHMRYHHRVNFFHPPPQRDGSASVILRRQHSLCC